MEKIIIGQVEWLRNDYRSDIIISDIIYPTLEHAYQALKTTDLETKKSIATTDNVREARKIGQNCVQSPGFNRSVVMTYLQRIKFQNTELAHKLLKTGDAEIVMEGYDHFWGTGDDGEGDNMLGNIITAIRAELKLVYGDITLEEEDTNTEEDGPPSLYDAILNAPDEDLAKACQNLFEASQNMVDLVDKNDGDAEYISRKTGVAIATVEDMISKTKNFMSALSILQELLESSDDSESDDEDEEDEDCDDEDECDCSSCCGCGCGYDDDDIDDEEEENFDCS